MDTQEQYSTPKENKLWKLKRFFRVPRLYVSLLESKDKQKAIFMRGFNKHEGTFAMDRYDVEEKEKLETYFTESIGVWELLKSFFKSLWLNK